MQNDTAYSDTYDCAEPSMVRVVVVGGEDRFKYPKKQIWPGVQAWADRFARLNRGHVGHISDGGSTFGTMQVQALRHPRLVGRESISSSPAAIVATCYVRTVNVD